MDRKEKRRLAKEGLAGRNHERPCSSEAMLGTVELKVSKLGRLAHK